MDGTLPLGLPESFEVNLPDFAGHAESAIGFTPNEGLPRVTEQQRQTDALTYQEQRNAALNLKDSIQVAHAYVSAGVAATKLGRELVRYQVGVADIRTELVNLQRANVKTAIATNELASDTLTATFTANRLTHVEAEYTSKLDEHRLRADRARIKAERYEYETEQLLTATASDTIPVRSR